MARKKTLYNPELGAEGLYTEVWKFELVKVKNITDLPVMNHYWQDTSDKLWGDFDDPMENVRRSFDAYREHSGYMTPDSIRHLRNQLNMSISEFADTLGINFSSLKQIENNQRVQTGHQEILFEELKNKWQGDGNHQ